jgi:signal transduction histidine kinase
MQYADSCDMRHDLPTTRVLLIDDESRSADLLSDMLASEPDILVEYQPLAERAEETAMAFLPTVILVDLRMPGIDGFEVIRRLKAAPCAAHTPVLMVSSIETPEQKAMGFAVGATDYLVKWPDRVELAARIRAHSRSHALARERDGANAALRDSQEQLLQRTRELLATQVELQQAKKMEAIGTLTGGIAHDMNNMLQIISGNLQLLRMALRQEEALCRRIDAASEGVRRGADLSSQLLAFACKQPLRPCAVDVAAAFRGLETDLSGGIRRGIGHDVVAREGLWTIRVDPRQFSSTLEKLITNAHEAMPDGGTVSLRAENVELPQGVAFAGGTLAPGQYVRILVTDSGVGMSEDVLELAFEPFFSTKPNARGPGLGLSTAFGFVRQSGGHIALRSAPGKGTTVTLHFPRAAEEAHARHPHGAADAACGGTGTGGAETILVVDDEDMVRAAAVEVLQGLGYRVLQAADGERAVGLMRSGIDIDLVFTDVVMPGPVRGIQVFEAAKRHLPHARVLFASGYPEKELMRDGLSADDVELLHKPYRLDDMARKVREMLSRASLDAPE